MRRGTPALAYWREVRKAVLRMLHRGRMSKEEKRASMRRMDWWICSDEYARPLWELGSRDDLSPRTLADRLMNVLHLGGWAAYDAVLDGVVRGEFPRSRHVPYGRRERRAVRERAARRDCMFRRAVRMSREKSGRPNGGRLPSVSFGGRR